MLLLTLRDGTTLCTALGDKHSYLCAKGSKGKVIEFRQEWYFVSQQHLNITACVCGLWSTPIAPGNGYETFL